MSWKQVCCVFDLEVHRYAQYSMKVQTHCPQITKASVVLWTKDWTSYPPLKRNISESNLAKNDVKVPRPKIDYILLLGRKNFGFIFLVIRRSETERSTKEKQFECFLPLLDGKKKEGVFNKGIYCLPHVEKRGKAQTLFQAKDMCSVCEGYCSYSLCLWTRFSKGMKMDFNSLERELREFWWNKLPSGLGSRFSHVILDWYWHWIKKLLIKAEVSGTLCQPLYHLLVFTSPEVGKMIHSLLATQ